MDLQQTVRNLQRDMEILMTGMRQLEQRYAQTVEHFNQQVMRIDDIDAVVFATVSSTDTSKFKLTKKSIDDTTKKIKKIDKQFHTYRDKQIAKQEKEDDQSKKQV